MSVYVCEGYVTEDGVFGFGETDSFEFAEVAPELCRVVWGVSVASG